MNHPQPVREHLLDSVKATPVLSMLAAQLGGMSINEWAALAGVVYSVILIIDKLKQMGLFGFIKRRLQAVLGSEARG